MKEIQEFCGLIYQKSYFVFVMGSANEQASQVYSIPLEGSKQPGFSHIYRSQAALHGLFTTPEEDIHSMKDVIIKNCLYRYPNRPFMGNIVLKTFENGGQTSEERSIKKYSYRQIYHLAENLGSFILQNNLYFQEEKTGMKMIGIYSKNRYEWAVVDIACILYGLTLVPLYETLGVENLTYCLKHSQISCCFVSGETLRTLLKLKGHGNLQNIVCFDEIDKNHDDHDGEQFAKKIESCKFKYFQFEECVKKDEQKFMKHEDIKVTEKNCLTFSYTSGTTGPPKGALLSHGNVISFLAAFITHQFGGTNEDDSYISFLPLPHSMERVIYSALIYSGSFIAFYNGQISKIKDDITFIKPTIFIAVPRLFNRIVESIQKKIDAKTGVAGWIVKKGIQSKAKKLRKNGKFKSFRYDPIIFDKIRETFGGRVRLMITGSAPIHTDVYEFMKIAMCCPFLEGYGQTQNTCVAFLQNVYDSTCGHVGGVTNHFEFKLADIPEMSYTSQDKDENGRPTPRGQIWIRGPAVFMGYYKDEEKTKETVTQDGWLKTGDVGMLLHGKNAMKIIDRKKNIFKLQQGEYVAAEKVQAVYCLSPLISELFLHGDPHQNYAIAILTTHKKQFLQFIHETLSIEGSFNDLCKNKQVRVKLLIELNKIGKENGLMSFEQAKNLHIEEETFESKKILSTTMKLQRFQAKQCYSMEIQQMYQEGMLPIK